MVTSHTMKYFIVLSVCYQKKNEPTVDRLPPGVASISVHEVDHVFDAMAVSVAIWVVAMLGVTLKTLV